MGRRPMPDEIVHAIAYRLREGVPTRVIANDLAVSRESVLRLAKRFEIRLAYEDRKYIVHPAKPGETRCQCGRAVMGKCVVCAARAWRKKYGMAE